MEKVLEFLQRNPVFYFATVEGDKPRVRPFGFYMAREGRLYFGMGTHKQSYQQILQNPQVEISTASPQGEWIRISGKAVIDSRPELTEAALETMPRLRELYNEQTGLQMGLVYLENGVAEIFDMAGRYEKIDF